MIKTLATILLICGAVGAQERPQAEKLTWQKLQSLNLSFSNSTRMLIVSPISTVAFAETWMVIKNDEMSAVGLSTECTTVNLQRAIKLTALTVAYRSYQTPEAKWVGDVLKACEAH